MFSWVGLGWGELRVLDHRPANKELLHKIELSQVNIILRGTTTARPSNALQQSPSTESKPQKSPSQKVINFFSSKLCTEIQNQAG